jgi:3-deoxy-D-manno-octulosonate 8-phosphate phosphatase KdsC-like HAD superfamily phosphatase
MSLQKAIIVDLDGTLTDCEHRVSHVQKEIKDWKSFNELMVHDNLNQWCFDIIQAMQISGSKIILLTGRTDDYRSHTEEWLKKNNVNYLNLFMRKASDEREDAIIKKEVYDNHIKDKFDVQFAIEDRKSVVKMWREVGVTCLQCDWGDF